MNSMTAPQPYVPDRSDLWSTHTWCRACRWYFNPFSGQRWLFCPPCESWACDDCRPALAGGYFLAIQPVLSPYTSLFMTWYPADQKARSNLSSWARTGRRVNYLPCKIDLGSTFESRRFKSAGREIEVVSNEVLFVISDAPISNRCAGPWAEVSASRALAGLALALHDSVAAPAPTKAWRLSLSDNKGGPGTAGGTARSEDNAVAVIGLGRSREEVQGAILAAVTEVEEETGLEVPWIHGGPAGLPAGIDQDDLIRRVKAHLGDSR